jgi:glucokinase
MTEGRFIGIDVGGTKVATAVLESGEYEVFDPVPTRTDSSDALVDQIVTQIGEHRGDNARAVAVGLPSIIEFATGRVRHSVNLPLADLPLRTLLSERCGLPVYVDNDASCAALAEASVAGQIVCENLIMFTVGTGVGGGLVLNGKLYRGATSAAELGHTMIGLDCTDGAPADPGNFPQPGSLETLASGRALDRLALESARAHPKSFLGRRLAKGDEITGHDAVEGAREGDVHCQHVVRVLGERLGIGIANAINTFDPDEIVIGGGVSLAGDLLLVPAERTARRHTVPGAGMQTKVRLARHGPHAGVLGAATVAVQEWALARAKATV